jgi:hypothetical protein
MAKKQEDINKEVKGLLKDIDEGYKKLGETNPFKSFNDFTEKGAKQLQDALRGVEDRVDRLGETIDDVVKKFKDLVEDIQKIDMSVQKQINWFRKTNDLLGEAKNILKGNRDATADQLRSVSDRLKYELKSKGVLKEHQDILQKINQEVKEREKAEKRIQVAYGVSGALIEKLNTGGTLSKVLNLTEASAKMKEVAEAGGNFKDVIKEGGKEIGKGLIKNLMSASTLVNVMSSAFKFAFEAALELDKAAIGIAKSTGLTVDGAEAYMKHIAIIRASSNDEFRNRTNVAKAITEINSELGTSMVLTDDMVAGQIDMTKKMGIEVEAASKLNLLFQANNQTSDEGIKSIAKQVTGLYKQKGITLDLKKVMEDVAKVNGQLRLQYGNNTEQIAKAVVLSKSLGMSIEQSNSATKKLLDFESSISNELEAELLTGKSLNLEEARSLALAGRTAEAQALVMEEVGGINDFMGRNVFEQESLAEAAGMTVDEFSNALIQQDNLNKLAPKQREELEKIAEELRNQGLETDANNLLSAAGDEEKLVNMMKQADLQMQFNELITGLKEALGEIMGGPMKDMLIGLRDFLKDGNAIQKVFDSIKAVVSIIGGLIIGRMAFGLAQGVASIQLQNASLIAQRGLMSAIIAQKEIEAGVETTKTAAAVTAAEASTVGAATPFIIGGIAAVMAALGTYQMVKDGAFNPNGGLVISKPEGGMLVPVAQGIPGDYAYLSTNSPTQTQDAMVTPAAAGAVSAPNNNNAELVAAMKAIAFNTAMSAKKEFDFDTFGTTVATKTVGISA